MPVEAVAISAWTTFVAAGLAVLVWGQIRDLRKEFIELRREFTEFRREVHSDIESLRSDLTQVALAVGANRPRASEN